MTLPGTPRHISCALLTSLHQSPRDGSGHYGLSQREPTIARWNLVMEIHRETRRQFAAESLREQRVLKAATGEHDRHRTVRAGCPPYDLGSRHGYSVMKSGGDRR